jgi:ABC-type phosphate transport system substrate-binding protein
MGAGARSGASILLGALLVSGGSSLGPAPLRTGSPVAVIVHPGVPVSDLSVEELRKIFLGDRQFWNQDLRITPLVPVTGSPVRAVLLDLSQKTEAQYRHHWIAKVFRAEAMSQPKVVTSPAMLGDLVSGIAGAISLVDASQVPRQAKVLTVAGKRPDDPGYPLR